MVRIVHWILLPLTGIFFPTILPGQLPNTQMFSFEIQKSRDGYALEKPRYLTFFNPRGYNNQPYFKDESVLYFVSNVYKDDATDLFYFDFSEEYLVQVTATSSSEYSPKYNSFNRTLNCIRVNEKGEQHIWEYPTDMSHWGKMALPGVINAGYYHFVSRDSLVVFRVGQPNEMRLHTIDSKVSRGLSQNIGRCFDTFSDGMVGYVHQVSDEKWMLRKMNPTTGKSEFVIQMPMNVQDFVLLRDNTIICGKGSILYYALPSDNYREWRIIDDLSFYSIGDISRLAVNKTENIIVVVGVPIVTP